jgi:transposase
VNKLKIFENIYKIKEIFWTGNHRGSKNESMKNNSKKNQSEPKINQGTFFTLPSGKPSSQPAVLPSKPRMQCPERNQVVMRMASLDSLLPEDHQARVVWDYVQGLEMTPLYQEIKAVEGRAGREPIHPRILMALWLYATLDAVGSARELSRRCENQHSYQWICGGVSVNHHTLSDFRVDHGDYLDNLLTGSVATLMHQDLVKMERVAQDGVRVRASAGAASFRRRPTLEQLHAEAANQVQSLRKELEQDPSATSRRQKAAQERASRERSERISFALEQMKSIETDKTPDKQEKCRVSTTDPETRVMKMADGGFRPAVNVQFATDTATQIITGVDVSSSGSDGGQMVPMLEQHRDRYDKIPDQMLVDGGFSTKEDINRTGDPDLKTIVYAPIRKPRREGQDPHAARYGDTPTISEWRKRMATPEAMEIYKYRASTAECVNAIARNRGLRQFMVRGLKKIRAVSLWFVLAHNLVRAATLRSLAAMRVKTVVASG